MYASTRDTRLSRRREIKTNIVEKFNQLPPDLQEKVIKFIDSLLAKKELRRKKKLKLDWVGGLNEYRDQYTALELQKEALDWWDESTRNNVKSDP